MSKLWPIVGAWVSNLRFKLSEAHRAWRSFKREHVVADRNVIIIANPHREALKQRKADRLDVFLDMAWEDRWAIWEGDDGQWYGSVCQPVGWHLLGPFSTRESALRLTESADTCTRMEMADERHKLRNWPGYHGK